ncbi:MAG: acetate--CoA ligase, partial [Chlamydiota bacterium]
MMIDVAPSVELTPLPQTEEKVFHPLKSFVEEAHLRSMRIYEEAAEDREAFWAKHAQNIDWFCAWDRVLDWKPPYAQWFVGGKLNASYNCLDRHIRSATSEKAALIWEGERGEQRILTYRDLYEQVNRFSNALKSLGVGKGDRVAIYLPQVPEAVIAMLSCARIGAVHTVVFAGFSSEALKDRIIDADAQVLITADGGFRKGKLVPLKELADKAIEALDCVRSVVVLRHAGCEVVMCEARDLWYAELMDKAEPYCPPEVMDAEDPLYFLYTSGTTGKPKGIVHTTGGYMVGVTATTKWVFDAKSSDIYWCTADVGWVTGHSYVVYGPLSNGMTQLLYEGAFDWPEQDRIWKMIEKHRVSILYTAPTAIRMFMKWGEEWPGRCDLSSLRLLGSVGEPINPEAWMWYHTHIGNEKCPIVDTWWQTVTGSIMIAPLPGLIPLKPGSATLP